MNFRKSVAAGTVLRGTVSAIFYKKEGDLPMLKRKANKIAAVLAGMAFAAAAVTAPLPAINSTTETEKSVITASAADSDNYAKLLQYSLYFYDANMCGTQVSENTALSWRSDCHTGDDADGGFHDAGDHAMFGLPQGYSASMLGWSYYEFKDAFNQTGQAAHYQVIADYFCDFFKASTKLDSSGNVQSFCYQKGDGDEDHSYWGPPENQSNSRRQFWTSSGASDIAAEYAAALALNYLNFGNSEDLKYAKALYRFSTQYNQCATDGPNNFYQSTNCSDDQAWAAGWLYLATKEESYKNDCASKQATYLGWVHCWDNVALGAACVNAHITGDWSKVNSYLGSQCTDPNSYFFMNQWGSARLNAAMQMCALSATKNSSADYSAWCKGQMTYLLGSNPANTCFVVGFASNSAKNPHHRAASGYNSYDEMGTSTTISSNGHTLVGALVGGPTDAGGSYNDSISDYVANEVAIDYNAGLVGAAAGLYSIYGTGSAESSITGVTKIYNGTASEPVQTTTATTTSDQTTTTTYQTTTTTGQTTTTQNNSSDSSSGIYVIKPNKYIVYSELPLDERMIGWAWSEFGIPAGELPTRVEITISSPADLGHWQGAFGSSTSVSPSYWTQSEDMQQTFSGKTGTITWDLDSATSSIIQTQYGGELKWGVWWIDCDKFFIDSITVYTNGSTASTTTTEQTTTTTTQTTATTAASAVKMYGDANNDGTVNIADVLTLNKNLLAGYNLSTEGAKNADVNKDGKPDSGDALMILQATIGLIQLP